MKPQIVSRPCINPLKVSSSH